MADDISQPKNQSDGARRFYSTGDYSDLTITCQGREWQVHKFQLCGQSEWFHKACSGDFKEAHDNKISLDDDDPQVVEAMLHYLYTGTYGNNGNDPIDIPPILLDVYTYSVADKYFIQPLKDKAARRFSANCEIQWNRPVFAQAIEEVYKAAPQSKLLEEIVVNIAEKHSTDIFVHQKDLGDFHRVLRSVPSFSADLLAKIDFVDRERTAKSRGVDLGHTERFKWSFKCPTCVSTFEVKVPLGRDITIRCPLNHNTQNFSWWASHGKHAKEAF